MRLIRPNSVMQRGGVGKAFILAYLWAFAWGAAIKAKIKFDLG